MAASIHIEKKKEDEFHVTVTEDQSRSAHVVTVKPDYHAKLTGGKISAEELVRRSFEFLLAREPKESILIQFDVAVIAGYFPEYEHEIMKQLSN